MVFKKSPVWPFWPSLLFLDVLYFSDGSFYILFASDWFYKVIWE